MPMPVPRASPPARGPSMPSIPPPAPEGSEGSAEVDPGMGGVDVSQIRQRLLQDPNYMQQFLQELQAANPQLYQLIQQNPQALLQLLMGGIGGGGANVHGGHGRPRGQGIQVSPEEKAAIDRVSLLY